MEKTVPQKLIGLVGGIIVIGVGLFLMIRPKTSLTDIVVLFAVVLLVITLMNLVSVLRKRKVKGQGEVLEAVLNLGFAIAFFVLRFRVVVWIPDIFVVWVILNSIIRFMSAVTYFRDGAPNYGAYFVNGFITLAAGILMFINNRVLALGFGLVAGIYVLWYGGTMIFDTFNEESTQQKMSQTAKKMQRKLRFAIPSIAGALLPRKLLQEYDEKIASEDANTYLKGQNVVMPEKNAGVEPYNVEILIHLSKKFMESFGHVDIVLGDEVLSYGNFDGHSFRLFGIISDGVVFKCNRERYLRESVYYDEKVLISFKVAFTDSELLQIKKNFENLYNNMEEWYCDTQLMEQGLLPQKDYTDIADKIYKGNDARFYKFKKGTLKTYFAVDTNCVKVADSIFENTNFDKPAIWGIVTPGTYYQFLMRELAKPGTKVFERQIYSKETLAYDGSLETRKLEKG